MACLSSISGRHCLKPNSIKIILGFKQPIPGNVKVMHHHSYFHYNLKILSRRTISVVCAYDLDPPPIDNDLHAIMEDMGAKFSDDRIVETFGDDEVALKAVEDGVVVVDLSHFGRIRVSGDDRVQFMHNQSTADFHSLKEGQGCDTVFVTPTARTIDLANVWVMVAETRFASHTIVLRRLVRVKEALCQMVISNKWGGWKQVDTEKAKIVKDLIFSDDFWNRVEYALELTEPLMSMLRYADTDEPCLGNIYDAMDSMLERMKSVIQRREQDPDTLYSTVEKIVLHRWNKMTTPLHLLAYALSPRYYSSEILDIPGRVPPYRDPEVAAGYKRALNRLFSDPDVASNVRREFVDFVSGKFAEPDAINDQSRLDAIGWWYLHGERYMYLQPLAIKILSQKNAITLLVSPTTCENIVAMLNKYIFFADKVEVQDITSKTCFFSIMGPRSDQLMEYLNIGDIVGKPYGTHLHYSVEGTPVTVGVGSVMSERGYSLLLSPQAAGLIWGSLLKFGAIPMGMLGLERLRVVLGRPAAGKELTDEFNALEAGLWKTISLTKGCYIGQETIARLITYDGVKQNLWGIHLDGPATLGSIITVNGTKVGKLTSYALGSDGVKHVGLGYVKRKFGFPGQEVEIEDVRGVLVDVPFISHSLPNQKELAKTLNGVN